ncbi:hypothetical protein PAAG_07844 [Paracoccidioides lutzii Pb01]|uniref:DUF7924 domain-containing protein n=1 Tax=Paracoccidioides lutzii (strain ATCC MYA-826 / Pb01) TaxID=502779 RepID=C1HAY0_PARBA|nr:hypothetical protein PAAG_07844 [Paracoccidioides lutzii Pb01]EEH37426.2 hypothetical protein PAAG_07844 [Paracoccidioides lutzii Pb01]
MTARQQTSPKTVGPEDKEENETGVIRVVAELIVPSAEGAVGHNRIPFQHLVESLNEAWGSSISLVEVQQLHQTLLSSQSLSAASTVTTISIIYATA